MSNNRNSTSLKILATLLFDIGVIIAYFKILSLYSFIHPINSTVILLVLLIALAVLNVVILTSSQLLTKLGFPYFIMAVFLSAIYCIVANILAIFSIATTLTTFIILQLILLSILVAGMSAIIYFSSKINNDNTNKRIEKSTVLSLKVIITNIEELIQNLNSSDGEKALPLMKAFKILKERINSSTPVGRSINNVAALEIEDRIINNISLIEEELKNNISFEKNEIIISLINKTTVLVKNREKLFII